MITRPLDLASRLRPISRSWDALFYVNAGALALFFLIFGSRFVLAPGLAADFALPKASSAATSIALTDVVIAVPAADVAVVAGQVLSFERLGLWLNEAAARARENATPGTPGPRLLVQASGSLPARELARVYALAAAAGFSGVLVATDEATPRR
jgi:biopolymer transport protein ExbD